jgi:hypothetical protein
MTFRSLGALHYGFVGLRLRLWRGPERRRAQAQRLAKRRCVVKLGRNEEEEEKEEEEEEEDDRYEEEGSDGQG